MKEENAIEVRNLTKTFKVYLDKGSQLKEKLLFSKRRRYEERKVLRGISFDVKKGEAIGLIGHNGCGKSTTLKLLSKIIYPNSGTVEMRGRVSSLIELGAGFHPDMSGRENIYTNASIFGLSKKEIDERVEDIIAFSELEEFIDNPVRTYSSGMYMRLAFSVAINVDADILLIDEILAVGDVAFQAKCFNKLREIKANGVTIAIVSHSLGQIEQICDRCIWIDSGMIKEDGSPVKVDYDYLEYMGKKEKIKQEHTNKKLNDEVASANKEERKKDIEITNVELVNENGQSDKRFKVGAKVLLKVYYRKNVDTQKVVMGIKIYRNDDVNAYGTNTQNERIDILLQKEGCIICEIEKLNLVTGKYFVDVAFRTQDMLLYDYKTKAIKFETYYPIYEEGICHIDHKWVFEEK